MEKTSIFGRRLWFKSTQGNFNTKLNNNDKTYCSQIKNNKKLLTTIIIFDITMRFKYFSKN